LESELFNHGVQIRYPLRLKNLSEY
jgi:hypothetical protein